MKRLLKLWLCLLTGGMTAVAGSQPQIVRVFKDDDHQFTGVAVSKTGRMFVNYPRWQSNHDFDVVEVVNGACQPFPNADWNSWHAGQSGSNKWVCVQAVWIAPGSESDELWVVDPAAPGMKKVAGDGAKLVRISLSNNQVSRIYNLSDVAGKDSYLNDVRVDPRTQTAYLTESEIGGLVIVDLNSGKARKVLTKSKPVKSDPKYKMIINGGQLMRDGKPMKVQSDGIALTPDGRWLYFKPLSDTRLFRVRTEDLRNGDLSENGLTKKVEFLGDHFSTSDGMIFDKQGVLYLGNLEANAIERITPDLSEKLVVQDGRLIWPDTFSWFPNGDLCVSCSQIQNMPWCNNGRSTRTTAYSIYKIKLRESVQNSKGAVSWSGTQ